MSKDSLIGDYSYIGMYSLISKTIVGRYCSIANGVQIGPGEHKTNWISTSNWPYKDVNWYDVLTEDETSIGNDVWIGSGAIIRRGVKIGDGAVIGANSFVNKDVEPYAIVAGSPARFIRYRFPEEVIQQIVASKWWELEADEARKVVEELEHDIKGFTGRRWEKSQ